MAQMLDPEGAEQAALDRVGELTGLRVLEVGAGDGRLTWTLARTAAFVYGIDPDTALIAAARAGTPPELADRVHFTVGSVLDLEEPPGTYEAAVLAWSL